MLEVLEGIFLPPKSLVLFLSPHPLHWNLFLSCQQSRGTPFFPFHHKSGFGKKKRQTKKAHLEVIYRTDRVRAAACIMGQGKQHANTIQNASRTTVNKSNTALKAFRSVGWETSLNQHLSTQRSSYTSFRASDQKTG